jgi:hypothetical protein
MIGDLGLVGDTRTAGLVDTTGRVVWLCLPHFDGDPVFGALVAGESGGEFTLGPSSDQRQVELAHRRYRPGSPVLETIWRVGAAELTLTEGMVSDVAGTLSPTTSYVRRLDARGGSVRCTLHFDPRHGAARRTPARIRTSAMGLVCVDGALALSLAPEPPLGAEPSRPIHFDVEPDRPLTTVLTAAHRGPLTYMTPDAAWRALITDEARWRQWSAASTSTARSPGQSKEA